MNENAKKWVADLRSGKYKQGKGSLNCDGKLCCLGVACEVAIQNGVKVQVIKTKIDDASYDGGFGFLPESVRDWLGLRTVDGEYKTGDCHYTSLAKLNDKGKTFAEIADIIEGEPEGLFGDELKSGEKK